MEKVICLAGGCFWGMERLYRALPGVLEVTAGYANGVSAEKANYEAVCSGVNSSPESRGRLASCSMWERLQCSFI